LEDVGSAPLKSGVARVQLDSAYAQALAGNVYYVFLTPEGDCKGLYVARKSATGFELRELGGGRASLDFDYRVVGHRKVDRPVAAPLSRDLVKTVLTTRAHS
jgi:hypothetical protein